MGLSASVSCLLGEEVPSSQFIKTPVQDSRGGIGFDGYRVDLGMTVEERPDELPREMSGQG